MKRPVVGGHRGHLSDVRENTVANFRQLLGKGIPYVEIDVQLTKDDQLAIFHDPRLEEATGMDGTVREHTLADLQARFEIDTAEDCIRWCKENATGIAFELKTGYLPLEADRKTLGQKLAKLIGQYDFHDSCFVFGKDYDLLASIKAADPRIPIGIIAPSDPAEALPLMKKLQAVVYLDYLEGLSESLVEQLHSRGYLVDGSVVNTEDRLRKALALGVDLLESDYPERILALLNRQ